MKSHKENKIDEFHMEFISSNIVSHLSLEALPIVVIEMKFASIHWSSQNGKYIRTNTKELQIE